MQKILVIRFSSIGDIVMTTPIVRCLKKQLGAEVHFLTKKEYLPLLEANPYLDKTFSIKKKVSEVLPSLKNEKYSCIIDLHKNIRSWQVRLALRKKVYAFNKLNFEKWLLVHFKINWLPNVHIVDRYLNTVKPLGVKNDGEGLDYFLPDHHLRAAVCRPPFVVFAIGGAHQTKRLPIGKMVAVCKKLSQPVLLIGGNSEMGAGDIITNASGSHVLNLCGKIDLHGSAALIRDAEKVITHDTGMMHIAAAFQKIIIVIWGNTVPTFGMSPYFGKNKTGIQQSFEVENLSCRPCSKIGFGECPKGHFKCMMEQDVEAILNAANC